MNTSRICRVNNYLVMILEDFKSYRKTYPADGAVEIHINSAQIQLENALRECQILLGHREPVFAADKKD